MLRKIKIVRHFATRHEWRNPPEGFSFCWETSPVVPPCEVTCVVFDFEILN